jgi:hypothetical protein
MRKQIVVFTLFCLVGCDDSLVPFVPRAHSADGGPVDQTKPRPLECGEHSDCPKGKVCSRSAPGCVDPVCGVVDPDGWVKANENCYSSRQCVKGYVCTPALVENLIELAHHVTGSRIDGCMIACDPCKAGCPAGMQCVQRPGGGGFCHDGPLADEGEPCFKNRFCRAKMGCYWGECVRFCTPSSSPGAGGEKEGCAPDQVCAFLSDADPQAPYPELHICRSGQYTDVGFPCGTCRRPDECIEGICSPANCDAGCPPPTRCVEGRFCSRERVVSFGQRCVVDWQCKDGLRCMDTEFHKACVP